MNLNLEGTKHEKALLVILAYVIGLTTGFVAFGLTTEYQKNETQEYNYEQSPLENQPQEIYYHESMSIDYNEFFHPKVAEEVNTKDTSLSETNSSSTVLVGYENGRLFSNLNGASVLLSVKSDQVSPEQAKSFADQGVHNTIPKYLVSDESNFIYFCEQKTSTDECNDLVYDVKNQVIHFVTVDGQKLTSTAEIAKNTIWEGSTLVIGNNKSLSAGEPWNLKKTN